MKTLVATYVIEDIPASSTAIIELAAAMGATWIQAHRNENEVAAWLDSDYRKHFRRAKKASFIELLREYPNAIVLTDGEIRLLALPLIPVDELPKSVKRLQMSNFKNIDETTAAQKQAYVSITINESLAMSFGKMAIAAAHAAQNLFLQMEKADSRFNDLWEKTNYQTIVHVDQLSELKDLTVAVEDLGLSEVASGSITAQATARVY